LDGKIQKPQDGVRVYDEVGAHDLSAAEGVQDPVGPVGGL